jgi:hypothetical protein
LDIKDTNGISFSGFPASIDVKPFRLMKFTGDGTHEITKTFTDVTVDQKRIDLSFTTIDIYGNLIDDESICSFYNHQRYELYFEVIYYDSDGSKVADFTVTPSEAYDSTLNIKTFTMVTDHLVSSLVYSSIYLNYTLLDGIQFPNGIMAKYYTNNNHLGQPLLTSILSESYIDSSDITTHWYRMHKEFKDFSVKMTALVKVSNTGIYSFITGFTSNF